MNIAEQITHQTTILQIIGLDLFVNIAEDQDMSLRSVTNYIVTLIKIILQMYKVSINKDTTMLRIKGC